MASERLRRAAARTAVGDLDREFFRQRRLAVALAPFAAILVWLATR